MSYVIYIYVCVYVYIYIYIYIFFIVSTHCESNSQNKRILNGNFNFCAKIFSHSVRKQEHAYLICDPRRHKTQIERS